MKSRMMTVLVAALLVLPVIAVSAQEGVDLRDATRQTASSQWMRFNPNGPSTPWGDYSNPVFGNNPSTTSTCMSGGLAQDTSYGSPPAIDLTAITWNEACFTKGNLGANDGPIGDDLMPNMSEFAMTYTFDGLGINDLAPTGDDVLVFTFDLPGNVLDPSYCSGASTQVAIGYDFGGFTWSADAAFPNDYFRDLGHITTLNIDNCQLSSTDFVVGDGNTLMSYPGNTLAAVGPNGRGGSIISGITRIPDGVTMYRPTIFHTNQTGNFSSDMVGHVWPQGGMTYSFADVICLVDVDFSPPTTTTPTEATTTTTIAETTTTTVAPTTTAEATTTTVADDPSDEGGGFPIWVLIIIAIGFALWWFLFGPGKRDDDDVDDPVPPLGPGGPIDPGDPEPPSTPGGSIPPHLHETPHECDWALYLVTGRGEEQIRAPKPGAHECCVYKVQVTSFVHENTHVVKERQDLAEEGRERASVGGTTVSGQDAKVKVGTRSWPYGDQGAMHGLGDMSEWPIVGPTPGPWPEYWQDRQFDEQLDTAYSAVLRQETRVKVDFIDGCGNSKNTYGYDATSNGRIKGTFECTNENTDPTCPIEISASASAVVVGKGDLGYVLDVVSHDDVDELPLKITLTGPEAEFRMADADSHRHDTDRDREIWEIDDSEYVSGGKDGNTWESIIENRFEAHSGMMIPQAMWPTTDRVTSVIDARSDSEFNLHGTGNIGHSPKSNCCAHSGVPCFCKPEFSLKVGTTNDGKLTVDGIVRKISNSDPMSETQTIFWD